MNLLKAALHHIVEIARVPSFSSYEERLHPYIKDHLEIIPEIQQVQVPGNSLVYYLPGTDKSRTIALAAHLDKINHYGDDFPAELPVTMSNNYVEGAMDDSTGLGIIMGLVQAHNEIRLPNLVLFFSEMEESKGLKEHPELLKNNGEGFSHGMGARNIAQTCMEKDLLPDLVITVDTTPLFKGDPGVALYSKHWEFNDLEPTEDLVADTEEVVTRFKNIDSNIFLSNNTNDYLHYGEVFNRNHSGGTIPSVALEPAIYPYHQQGERVFIKDIERTLSILSEFVNTA